MAADKLPYFKFITAIIDNGIWARLSPAARALYPALLRFSDRNYRPVYPGSGILLKLTGFKQKSTLRKARRELEEIGLIVLARGGGRKNTCYHFRFDFAQRGAGTPPGDANEHPSGGDEATLPGPGRPSQRGDTPPPGYNQIHININHQVPREVPANEESRLAFLQRRFGAEALDRAKSECRLAGLPERSETLEKILYPHAGANEPSWPDLAEDLARQISQASMDRIQNAFLEQREGMFVFRDILPEHLRAIVERHCESVFFEPEEHTLVSRKDFWTRTVDPK